MDDEEFKGPVFLKCVRLAQAFEAVIIFKLEVMKEYRETAAWGN